MLSRTARILQLAKTPKADESHEKENKDPYEFKDDDHSFETEYVSPSESSGTASNNLEIGKRTREELEKSHLNETVLGSNITNSQSDISPEISLQQKIYYYIGSLPSTEKRTSNGDTFNVEKARDVSSTGNRETCSGDIDITDQHYFDQDAESKDIQVPDEYTCFDTDYEQSDSYNSGSLSGDEYLSDSDYLPSGDEHSSTESYPCSETQSTSEITPEELETTGDCAFLLPVRNEPTNCDTKQNSMADNKLSASSLTNAQNDFCPFCFEEIGHFSRHLERNHSDEEAVKKILTMPVKSSERRNAIIFLRRKGNFVLQREKNIMKPIRKPAGTAREKKVDDINYSNCVNCFGVIKSTYLWRHRKHCKANTEHIPKKFGHRSDSRTFLMCTGLLGDFLNRSRLSEIFKIIRADDIGFTVRTDPLICLYGESLSGKHKRKQMYTVVSQKMRRMAKLLIALKKSTTISNFIDALKPEIYSYILAATKVIARYDSGTLPFESPSLALQLGTDLKFMCQIAKKAIITKNPLIGPVENREEKLTAISELHEMITAHWCNDIGSLANKVLNEKKVGNPKLLPTTEDVSQFHKYTSSLANLAYEGIVNEGNVEDNYNILVKCTLALLVLFNRRRIGEIQFLDMESYERPPENLNQDEMLSCLTEFEKSLCNMFKRVVVFGKGSKPVPILFSKKIQKYTDLIIQIRRTTNFVPKENKYVFATSGSTRWISGSAVLQKLARECGAQQPELLTSTRFRKQIATLLQLMSFEKDELLQVAKFMGHTEKTHTEFYRLTDNTYQTAKVAKILMLLESGKGAKLKGKSLNDINFDDGELINEELVDCNYSSLASGNLKKLKCTQIVPVSKNRTSKILVNCKGEVEMKWRTVKKK
ncbi:hypothetical protein JTB14_016982 [Gonioctena quinquepunctata]|nr:hypothetical protein JTB14_016982 [Gonioctena quinquepunctata]